MFHRRPFAPRGPSALGVALRTPLRLERLVLAEGQAPPVPRTGGGARRAQRTGIAGTGRKLGGRAWDQWHGVAVGTGDGSAGAGQAAGLLRAQDTAVGPGAGTHVDARRGPAGHLRAGHRPQIDVPWPQTSPALQGLGPHLHDGMLRLVGRADDHCPRHVTVQVPHQVCLAALAGCGAALAAVAHVWGLKGAAPLRRDVLLEAPALRPSLRGGFRGLRDDLRDGVQPLLHGGLIRRAALRLRQPWLPPLHCLPPQAQGVLPRGPEPLCDSSGPPGPARRLPGWPRPPCPTPAPRMAEKGERRLHAARAPPRGGVQGHTELPGPASAGLLRQGDRPLQQNRVQRVGDQPHPTVPQRALAGWGLLRAQAVPPPLPPLVPDGARHRVPSPDVAVGLPQRGAGQHPRVHGGFASIYIKLTRVKRGPGGVI